MNNNTDNKNTNDSMMVNPSLTTNNTQIDTSMSPPPETSMSPPPETSMSPPPETNFSPPPETNFSPLPETSMSPPPETNFNSSPEYTSPDYTIPDTLFKPTKNKTKRKKHNNISEKKLINKMNKQIKILKEEIKRLTKIYKTMNKKKHKHKHRRKTKKIIFNEMSPNSETI